ncbi:hypothetical protein FRX31_016163 [Thalictrum thalictroides]|uniref:Uncharacterized protein n=1 Tax=Thalictrum thalictroides TaxID=46969 RepID=A0A7J6WBB0_THATH|nr:hypothetical protein FRX31_016163 [Thalictrum thalictroides]
MVVPHLATTLEMLEVQLLVLRMGTSIYQRGTDGLHWSKIQHCSGRIVNYRSSYRMKLKRVRVGRTNSVLAPLVLLPPPLFSYFCSSFLFGSSQLCTEAWKLDFVSRYC